MNSKVLFPARWSLVVLCFLIFPYSSWKAAVLGAEVKPSSSPVIGIFAQPISSSTSTNETYIAASYVKWAEAGGARSIPIPYSASKETIDDIFGQINGILFPGGGAAVPNSAKYAWKLAKDANDKYDDFFPIWGTCLGFEWLIQLQSNNFNDTVLESGFDAENISLPLFNVEQYEIYKSNKIYHSVQNSNITMNNHHQGISPKKFQETKSLSRHWKVTSTNVDAVGKPFVSTIEPYDTNTFPFYGVQYHPEKNAFEYATYPHTNIPYEAIDHSSTGIQFSLHLSQFFINLVRRNYYAAMVQSASAAVGATTKRKLNAILENKQLREFKNQYPHRYTKPDKYPLVYSYPMKRGIKFEQIFIIPDTTIAT